MSSNKVCLAILISAGIIGIVYMCKKSNETNLTAKPHFIHAHASSQEQLPIACISTLGGDVMMCPSSGICPLNGQRCQPSAESKPMGTDWYYPQSTMDMLYAQHHNNTFLTM